MRIVRTLALLVCPLLPFAALAAGGHDAIGCKGCHSLHAAKGEIIFTVAPNKTYLNPKTKQPYSGTTALCLACHQDADKGGQGIDPVSQHLSHPFFVENVNPRIAKVPPEVLRDGKFDCLGCHDPHPSNPYYRYLRVDTAGGKQMDKFCAACHAMKADSKDAAEKVAFFSSMDEGGSRVLAPVSKKAAPVPEKAASVEKKPRHADKAH